VEMQDDVAELLRSATREYANTKVCVCVCLCVCVRSDLWLFMFAAERIRVSQGSYGHGKPGKVIAF